MILLHCCVFRSSSTRTGTSRVATMRPAATALSWPPTWAGATPAGWRAAASWSTTAPTTWETSISWGGASTLTTWAWWEWETASGLAVWSPWYSRYSVFKQSLLQISLNHHLILSVVFFLFFTAQGILQDEDLREGELRWSELRADGRLRQHHGPLPYVWLHVLQRDGRPLADVRAAPIQRQDDVPEARRVQELQGHGHEWQQVHEHEAYQGFLQLNFSIKSTN